jgi:hypothetical protein
MNSFPAAATTVTSLACAYSTASRISEEKK